MNNGLIFIFLSFCIVSCREPDTGRIEWPVTSSVGFPAVNKREMHPLEEVFINAGLVDVHTLDTSIKVDLRYGGTDNFMGIDFYHGFNKCYLQPSVAGMLVKAQQTLKRYNPDLSLLVWDAARPLSVQKKMWKTVVPPPGVSKSLFVSNPAYGSIHNFGCAVDVTIVDASGKLLDMGTDLDHFGREAWPVEEQRMLKDGKLTMEQVTNRKLLRSVMYEAGFWNIQTEWWHFNAMRREAARQKYAVIK